MLDTNSVLLTRMWTWWYQRNKKS